MYNRWMALLLMLLAAFQATAKECKGVDFLDQVQMAGTNLELNGLGLREATFFKVDVYVAALYAEQKSADPNDLLDPSKAKQLVLHFLREVKRDDITKAWAEGFKKNAKNSLTALEQRIATLNGWMTDVTQGSRLTFSYLPASGLQVSVGDNSKGQIQGEDFAKSFFAIWLGVNPPNPGLKSGLLGGSCG